MANAPRMAPLFGLLAVVLAGPAGAQDAKTLTVTDDRGVTVQVPAQPKRIASISYFADDVALALGIKPVAST